MWPLWLRQSDLCGGASDRRPLCRSHRRPPRSPLSRRTFSDGRCPRSAWRLDEERSPPRSPRSRAFSRACAKAGETHRTKTEAQTHRVLITPLQSRADRRRHWSTMQGMCPAASAGQSSSSGRTARPSVQFRPLPTSLVGVDRSGRPEPTDAAATTRLLRPRDERTGVSSWVGRGRLEWRAPHLSGVGRHQGGRHAPPAREGRRPAEEARRARRCWLCSAWTRRFRTPEASTERLRSPQRAAGTTRRTDPRSRFPLQTCSKFAAKLDTVSLFGS